MDVTRRKSTNSEASLLQRRLSDKKADLGIERRKSAERKASPLLSRSSAKKEADGEKTADEAASPQQRRSSDRKDGERRKRRPSICDLGTLEYETHSRRRSNESRYSRASKDDMDVQGRRERAKSLVDSTKKAPADSIQSNLDKCERPISSRDADKKQWYRESGNVPKLSRKSLGRKAYPETRRSSHGSEGSQRRVSSRRSFQGSAHEDDDEEGAESSTPIRIESKADARYNGNSNESETMPEDGSKGPIHRHGSHGDLAMRRSSSEKAGRSTSHESRGSRRRTESSERSRPRSVHETEAGEDTSERRPLRSTSKSSKSRNSIRSIETSASEKKAPMWQRMKRRKWQLFCCLTLLLLLVVLAFVGVYVLKTYFNEDEGAQVASEFEVGLLGTSVPSATPSVEPSVKATTLAPTPSPLGNVNIVVIVQLYGKPEETGFSLVSADESTIYISRPVGSLSGKANEVVMEVFEVLEGTDLVFAVEDENGLCCAQGNGYYRVLSGTGDKKTTLVSGERSAEYAITVGRSVVQVGGLDPNEYCKPCPNGKDCGRCAWCNADEGWMPDTVFSYQCHSAPKPIKRKCFVGEKRIQLYNQYVAAMGGCTDGFEAPQIQASSDATLCVEEVTCIKTFPFVEPNCEDELSGSVLVRESCQDVIGGVPFGYSWGIYAPREKDCRSSSGDFAASLAQRCCADGVAFCSTFSLGMSGEDDFEKTPPTPAATLSPTVSSAPTWDGHPITLLIQLDDFPSETGLTITSSDKNTTFLERPPGHYTQKSQVVVEKVRIPEGTEAILSLTDKSGDGICCDSGVGYFQVYSEQGSLILDEEGSFSTSISKTFVVGEPETLPPTTSASPSASIAPTFDRYPITIAVQLDQWGSDETGISIHTMDGSKTFYEWPTGSFSEPSSLVVKQVYLPRDVEARLILTDSGGDGFCCLYGDGFVKIYAGESADDESALLASQSGVFESALSIGFRVGPAPSVSPATTLVPTVSTTEAASTERPTSSSPPTIDALEMTVVLQLDKYSAETGWSIDSVDGLSNFASRPVGYYEKRPSEKIVETIRLPEGFEYRFTITDFMGDGTCCWAGNGFYALYEGRDIDDDSKQVLWGSGDFGIERVHEFVAGKRKTQSPTSSRVPSQSPSSFPTATPSYSSKPTAETFGVELTIKFDNDSDETGWEIYRVASEDEDSLIIERPPGYYAGNDTLTVIESLRLEAGDYRLQLLDTGGDGFCCAQGVGYYSLYANDELLLFREGRFEYSYNETFAIEPPIDSLAIAKSAPMLRGSSYGPKRQRKHVDQA